MSAVLPEPKPIDLGCGAHVPVRWSRLCVLYRYERRMHASRFIGEKTFAFPMIAQTVSGVWEFHGKSGAATIDPSVVIAGSQGLHFGCKHSMEVPSVAHIVSLRPGALDETGEAVFDVQLLNIAVIPDLKRAIALETADEFDSFIFEVFGSVSQVSTNDSSSQRLVSIRIQRAKRFIEQNALENITIADIAASINVSPFTCLREFRCATGMSPHRYLDGVRLKSAKRFLGNRRLTIGEVGSRIGIHDRHYFTRWFVKQTGIPPQRFRDGRY